MKDKSIQQILEAHREASNVVKACEEELESRTSSPQTVLHDAYGEGFKYVDDYDCIHYIFKNTRIVKNKEGQTIMKFGSL